MNLLKTTVLCAVLAGGPGAAVGYSNGYFDAPPVTPVQKGLAASIATFQAPQPTRFRPVVATVAAVSVPTVAAPRQVALGPRTCEGRTLDLYGGQVRVCARPASPILTKDLSTKDLSRFWR